MKWWVASLTLVLLMCWSWPAAAQVKLEWKFKTDDKFYIREDATVTQTMEFKGARQKSELKMVRVQSFTVKKATKDSVELEQKFESVEMKSDLDQEGYNTLAKLLKGTVFTATLDGSGKIVKFEGYNDLVKKFAGEKESTAKMMKAAISEDVLRQDLVQLFSFLPAKAVKANDHWNHEFQMPLGPMGSFKADCKYTYTGTGTQGIDKNLELISTQPTMTYAPPPRGQENPLGLKITGGDLKADDAKITVAFDAEKGKMGRCEMSMKVKGSITIESGGKESIIGVEQNQSLKIQLLDKTP